LESSTEEEDMRASVFAVQDAPRTFSREKSGRRTITEVPRKGKKSKHRIKRRRRLLSIEQVNGTSWSKKHQLSVKSNPDSRKRKNSQKKRYHEKRDIAKRIKRTSGREKDIFSLFHIATRFLGFEKKDGNCAKKFENN